MGEDLEAGGEPVPVDPVPAEPAAPVIDPVKEAEAFLDEEARSNPVLELAHAVKVADSMRRIKVIVDRKERAISILLGNGSAEQPKRQAPEKLAAHLNQPRAVGMR